MQYKIFQKGFKKRSKMIQKEKDLKNFKLYKKLLSDRK